MLDEFGMAEGPVNSSPMPNSDLLHSDSTVLDETAGDIKVLSKGKGIMRLMSTNLRRVKREQGDGDEMAERVWTDTLQAVEDAGVDVWAAQDTGVEDGGSPGQAALWTRAWLTTLCRRLSHMPSPSSRGSMSVQLANCLTSAKAATQISVSTQPRATNTSPRNSGASIARAIGRYCHES